MKTTFDPFENRISRDIRNELSIAFLAALRNGNVREFQSRALSIKQKAPDPVHQTFVDERIRRCIKILEQVSSDSPRPDDIHIAFELWSGKLFFECHEWLEDIWLDLEGLPKKGVQGLIRTAGAFTLYEAGRLSPAKSSAQKACALLREYKAHVPTPFDPDELIECLQKILQYG